MRTLVIAAEFMAVSVCGLIFAAISALIMGRESGDDRTWMVIDPFNKPVFGTAGAKTRDDAIAAAERYVGRDWRWMADRDFRLSRG